MGWRRLAQPEVSDPGPLVLGPWSWVHGPRSMDPGSWTCVQGALSSWGPHGPMSMGPWGAGA
eukprot:1386233-Pyramimonas_sp.AAC.1